MSNPEKLLADGAIELDKAVQSKPETIINQAIEKLRAGDAGAHWEPEVIEAAKFLKQNNIASFMRMKQEIKQASASAQIGEWSRTIKADNNSTAEDTSQAGELVTMVTDNSTLFHDTKNECYVTFHHNGHRENWMIGSTGFNDWLGYEAYTKLGFCPGDTAVRQAITTLTGIAKYDGEEHEIFMRSAPYADGYIIDLTNDEWQAVLVDSRGHKVISDVPVKFVRSNTVAPLPIPSSPNVELLWKYVNVQDDDKLLTLAFALESWRPELPFPVANIVGEEGSGKSSTHKAIRAVTDPNTVPLRTAPKNTHDIQVAAENNWQLSFENMSNLTLPMQDILCSLATGGGSSEREWRNNKSESVFSAMRPAILNSIENIVTRPDLISRAILLEIPAIDAEDKISEANMWANFEKEAPQIFAGLLDLFSRTLQELPAITVTRPPRMVDFTYLGEAMLKASGVNKSFNAIYKINREKSLNESISSSPAALAIVALVYSEVTWKGSMKELKDRLENQYKRDGEGWPRSERGLSGILKRMKSSLRSKRVGVEFLGHKRDGSHVRLYNITREKESQNNDHNDHTVTDNPKNGQNSLICDDVTVVKEDLTKFSGGTTYSDDNNQINSNDSTVRNIV